MVLGFAGVLIATLGNHGGGSARGVAYMLIATVLLFTLAGPGTNPSPAGRQLCRLLCEPVRGRCGLLVLGAVAGRTADTGLCSAGVLDLLALAFICGAGMSSGPCS